MRSYEAWLETRLNLEGPEPTLGETLIRVREIGEALLDTNPTERAAALYHVFTTYFITYADAVHSERWVREHPR